MAETGLTRRTITLPAIRKALQDLEEALGGRDALIAALAHAPSSPTTDDLYGLLADPAHASTSLAELCAQADVPPGTLLKTFNLAELTRAQAVALRQMTRRLPGVIEDLATRAGPHTILCDACEGRGASTPDPTPTDPNPGPIPCDLCRGTGQLTRSGDLERQRIVVEMAGLVKRGGGLQIIQTQQTAIMNQGAGGSETVQMAVQEILGKAGLRGRGTRLAPEDDPLDAETEGLDDAV